MAHVKMSICGAHPHLCRTTDKPTLAAMQQLSKMGSKETFAAGCAEVCCADQAAIGLTTYHRQSFLWNFRIWTYQYWFRLVRLGSGSLILLKELVDRSVEFGSKDISSTVSAPN